MAADEWAAAELCTAAELVQLTLETDLGPHQPPRRHSSAAVGFHRALPDAGRVRGETAGRRCFAQPLGLDSTRLDSTRLDWAGLDLTGLDWTRLDLDLDSCGGKPSLALPAAPGSPVRVDRGS